MNNTTLGPVSISKGRTVVPFLLHPTTMPTQVAGPPPTAEETWLQAAQRGDRAAFGHIVQRYHRLILSLAYRLGGDAHLAEDVAQDTFLKAWRYLPDFRPEYDHSLRAWLCRIAHNRTIDLLRQQRPHTDLSLGHPTAAPSPLRQALTAETTLEVQAAIRRLPELSRTALILREYEEMSYAEIAAVLDIPIGTVMSRLYHARRRLAEELAPLLHTGALL